MAGNGHLLALKNAMTSGNMLYTRIVGWVKTILPLVALALLSTLFLFARRPSDTPDFPIAQLEDLAREQQIIAPEYSSVTRDGSIISLTAKSAKPDAQDPFHLFITDLLLELDSPDGTKMSVTSGSSTVNVADQTAQMTGLTRVITSSGYTMETVGIGADLATGEVISDGPLEIRAPFGELSAGKVHINLSSNDQGKQIVFTQGIRLLYTLEQTQP